MVLNTMYNTKGPFKNDVTGPGGEGPDELVTEWQRGEGCNRCHHQKKVFYFAFIPFTSGSCKKKSVVDGACLKFMESTFEIEYE